MFLRYWVNVKTSVTFFQTLWPSHNVITLIYHFNFQALKDLDFEVRDRLFLESVMDIEFQDSNVSEKAIFYKGTPIINSHALSFYKSKKFLELVQIENLFWIDDVNQQNIHWLPSPHCLFKNLLIQNHIVLFIWCLFDI